MLDTNALISFLLDQPAAQEVEKLLWLGPCGMPAPCVAEVKDRLIRRYAVSEDEFLERVLPLGGIAVAGLPIDIPTAQLAGEIRAAHYARRSMALSLTDCLLLATAMDGDQIATADSAVLRVAKALDIGVFPLLDSRGNRSADPRER